MPYEVRKMGEQWCVFKKGASEKMGCHGSEDEAHKQMAALYANEKAEWEKAMNDIMTKARP